MKKLWPEIKSRWKIILLAIVPLMTAASIIAYTVRHQAIVLEQQQQKVIKQTYLDSKDSELKNYIELVRRSITHLYDRGDPVSLDRPAAYLMRNPASTIMPPLRKFLLDFLFPFVKPLLLA